MTCKETIGMICEYLEGRLSRTVAVAVQRHIGRCQNCRLVHEAASKTLEAYFDKDFVPHAHSPHAKVA